MNTSQFRRCLEITKKLQRHPAAKPFLKPVDVNSAGMENYYEIIDNPQDLTSIENRLKAKEYRSVREWKRDISMIWSNAAAFAGSKSYVCVLADHLARIFEKELKSMSTTNIPGWLNRVNEIKTEFCDFLAKPPESLKESAPLEMIERKTFSPLLPDDYSSIFRSLKSLPSQNDRKELGEIVGNPESELDLTKLSLSTLHKAQEFVKAKTPDTRRSLFDIRADEAAV